MKQGWAGPWTSSTTIWGRNDKGHRHHRRRSARRILIFAATRPDTFRVQRSTSIKAPPEKIFPLINDLQRWGAWSPYEKRDPAMKRTFGATRPQGAVYEWDGNKSVGKGRMEITDATPPSTIVIKLDFISPFEGTTSPSSL